VGLFSESVMEFNEHVSPNGMDIMLCHHSYIYMYLNNKYCANADVDSIGKHADRDVIWNGIR